MTDVKFNRAGFVDWVKKPCGHNVSRQVTELIAAKFDFNNPAPVNGSLEFDCSTCHAQHQIVVSEQSESVKYAN